MRALDCLAGKAIEGAFGPTAIEIPVEHRGRDGYSLALQEYRKDEEGCLTPAKYRLEVESLIRVGLPFHSA